MQDNLIDSIVGYSGNVFSHIRISSLSWQYSFGLHSGLDGFVERTPSRKMTFPSRNPQIFAQCSACQPLLKQPLVGFFPDSDFKRKRLMNAMNASSERWLESQLLQLLAQLSSIPCVCHLATNASIRWSLDPADRLFCVNVFVS